MAIEVNVTREFVVNGKPYRSLGEVPPELRGVIQGALGSPYGDSQAEDRREIIVNGKRYDDVKAMPDGVREMYEVAMQCIGPGKEAPAVKQPARLQPIVPRGSSSRWLMLGGLMLCLLFSLLLLLLPR